MGFRLYKSVRLGKGVRLNLSKTRGRHLCWRARGTVLGPLFCRTTRTVGAPGTGVYYRKDTYSKVAVPAALVRRVRRSQLLPCTRRPGSSLQRLSDRWGDLVLRLAKRVGALPVGTLRADPRGPCLVVARRGAGASGS